MSEDQETHQLAFQDVWNELVDREALEKHRASETFSQYEEDPTHQFRLPKTAGLPQVQHLFVAGETIGKGGNGEVFSARQMSLDRTIAVKRPNPESQSPTKLEQLIREARVIGFLEHQNIPPVHFVGEGSGPEDLIVGLKRIEGREFLSDVPRGQRSIRLEDDLDVLIKVCDAVGFAHDQGVVHLDLKPANVMIGKYGEVYVLDWGLAVAYRDDVTDTIPRPILDGRLRGTPSYVAPEQVKCEPPTPATDVYQLGGLLHRLLTGEPPNTGETVYVVLENAFRGQPRNFGPWVTAGLAAICTKALSLNPADRYADANELRKALANYRRNVREFEAFERVQQCIDELRNLTADDAPTSEVYRAYGASRLALVEYERLDEAKESTAMRAGIMRTMIEWELSRENPGGAEVLLEELPGEATELRDRVVAMKARMERDLQELEHLRREVDPNQGRTARFIFWMAVGTIILATEAVPFALGIPSDAGRVLGGHMAFLVLLGVVSFALRSRLDTRNNRSIIGLVWVLSVFGLALRLTAFVGRIDFGTLVSLDLGLVALTCGYGALFIDRRVIVAVPLYLACAGLAAVVPEYAMLTFGFGHFLSLTAIAVTTTLLKAN